jgi:3D (Asp-Asp-Asp) domain-containing protein
VSAAALTAWVAVGGPVVDDPAVVAPPGPLSMHAHPPPRRTPAKPRLAPRRRHAKPIRHRRHTLVVTAYCWTGNRTASGAWPGPRSAATLDRSIPFGTRLRVAGVGELIVDDRIGHGSDVDVYLGAGPTCERAAELFGRRELTVVIGAGR